MWAGPNRTEIWDGEERIRGFGDLVPHTIPGRISSRRSYRSAGPLGKTRSHNIEMHRDGPQRIYAHQLRARFVPVLPGFYRGFTGVLPSGFGNPRHPGTCCNSGASPARRGDGCSPLPTSRGLGWCAGDTDVRNSAVNVHRSSPRITALGNTPLATGFTGGPSRCDEPGSD